MQSKVNSVDRHVQQSPGRADLALAGIAGVLALVAYGVLMLLWRDHGVFAQYNIVFDADPNMRLASIAHGWGSDGLVHPLLPLMFSIPIRIVVSGIASVSAIGDPQLTRVAIAIWIAPLASALKVSVVYLVGRALGASVPGATGLSLIAGFSFAPAVFGALPDHYPLSATALTVAFAWALAVSQGRVSDNRLVWFGLAALVAGITITNCVAVLALFLACRVYQGQGLVRALTATALLGAVALTSVIGVAALASRVMEKTASASAVVEFTNSYWRKPDTAHAIRYAAALANTLVAPAPAVMSNSLAEKERAAGRNAIDVQFTYDGVSPGASGWIRIVLVLGVLAGGALRGWRTVTFRPIVAAALMVLLFNGALHAVWGTEWFLYSMHWQPALLVLAAGWLIGNRGPASLMFLVFGVASAVWSVLLVRDMLGIIEKAVG